MNILIYIPDIKQADGGIRQYSVGLLKLLSTDHFNKYFIYHNNNDPEVIAIVTMGEQLVLVTDRDIVIKKEYYFLRKLKGLKRKTFQVLNWKSSETNLTFADRLCMLYDIDIIHCPYQFIPQTKKSKLITTLHDVQELHFPEYFSAEARAHRATAYLDFLRRADKVFVSYDHVKRDIVKYFDVPDERIGILLLNMEQLWFDKLSKHDIADTTMLDIPDQFLLYPANTWKHKNHLRLIKAIYFAKEHFDTTINLVCSGHQNEHFLEIQQLINELDLSRQVVFTGVLDEKILYSLYQHARGVIIPTTYEAGSFPLYESILMKRPVVCSNVTSLPETIGSDEFVFDPFKIPDIADKMMKLWSDETFRNTNLKQIEIAAVKIRNNSPLSSLNQTYRSLSA